MYIIGITGGVGSGKSRVMEFLEGHYPCRLIRTDDLAKELMEYGTSCFHEVAELFGNAAVLETGDIPKLNRAYIAERVFHDPELLHRLNQIVHPAVRRAVLLEIEEAKKQKIPFFFLESALLLSEKYNEICHELWYVYAGERIRKERLHNSRGYSEEKSDSIMKNQMHEDEFRAHADFVLENGGGFDATIAQIQARMKQIEERCIHPNIR